MDKVRILAARIENREESKRGAAPRKPWSSLTGASCLQMPANFVRLDAAAFYARTA
jgi:hypothetical protein